MTVDVVTCGSCGTRLRANAKFCDECGIPAAALVDTAQYKQVTVLFADVVRSMDIAAAVDMERLREIMTEVVERSAAVVRRYGGTAEPNGDGVMALFGAPVALEDHAYRGCLAALAIQEEADRLAAEMRRLDGVALKLRVGLDSGRVIAGELGSGSLGYAATGEHVGLAQRMESAAPPGGVMLSEATAHLVEQAAMLAEPEWVRIKGKDEPVRAHRLLAIGARDVVGHADARLVGRRWEMAALEALLDRAVGGRGGVVNVLGTAGIGKSRVAREIAALAAGRGVEVFWAFCESHARDIPFHAVTRLLRAASGVAGVDGETARARLRTGVPAIADAQDLLLLHDLLGIADLDVPLPQIDPDARRRRLTALINTMMLARTRPSLYIVEDAHWIDPSSESMLADLLSVIPRTPSMVLITCRPEYDGALTRVHGSQTIDLAALGDSDTATLIDELLGSDPSVAALATIIADRADGNPFFGEEMVRELVQRGVLTGEHGDYVCRTDVAELSVPATVQAAIEARIDRLGAPAKQTLNAASVIGVRFEADLLAALKIDAVVDELLSAELIDQVRFTPHAEYAFRHALIRAVAYESQLRSDRAQWHLRLAAAIQERAPESVEENAALIAEHLESANELHAAYGWQMRASTWSRNRDLGAARLSWERASRIADLLSEDDPDQLSMRIAPRTMLCATDWLTKPVQKGWGRFAELRELCNAAGDKVSLAVGMTGLASELLYTGRAGEGSRLASEQMALLESIGDPNLTTGLAFLAFANWFNTGEFGEILRWTQTVVDLADDNPDKGGGFGIGSPLAVALTFRGVARAWLGRPGWRQDLRDAIAIARTSDATTLALVVSWTCVPVVHGVLRADDALLRALDEAVLTAQRASADFAVTGAQFALGIALVYRDSADDGRRGLELLVKARDMWLPDRAPSLVPVAEVWAARERAKSSDIDAAIPVMRQAVDETHAAGRIGWTFCGIGVLVETLLKRGAERDLAEAQQGIDRLTALCGGQSSAVLDITLLRLRALLARTRGDSARYSDLLARYRTVAESLGFEGHIAWAKAMPT
ncbi:AAA family ATPase [Mycobacterium sp. B14F4]|uniref:AAA family ATPase n=1 Tax=Mycobacterium sp. B14F4 TaxID=3153565 RepID=UPI00325E20A2